MARLGKNEAGLPALDPEMVCEQRGIPIPLLRRVGVDLPVQGLKFARMRSGLGSVEQLER
jgi:hypothetical protein